MSEFAVDASVAAKWFLHDEAHSEAARRLAGHEELIAPELCLAELTNILWKYVRRGGLSVADADEALATCRRALAFRPAVDLAEASMHLALEHNISAYDALYAALAIRENCQLVTADRKLYNALAPALPETMLWVEDVPGPENAPA